MNVPLDSRILELWKEELRIQQQDSSANRNDLGQVKIDVAEIKRDLHNLGVEVNRRFIEAERKDFWKLVGIVVTGMFSLFGAVLTIYLGKVHP